MFLFFSLTLGLSMTHCFPPAETGGEAGPADQTTREAGSGWRQPGPERGQRVAQVPPHERDDGTTRSPSDQHPQ